MTLALTQHPDMSRLTTLRLGGNALALAVVRGAAGLEELGRRLPGLGGRPFALGFGSNLLPAGGEAGLTLVQAANVSAPEFIPQADGKTLGKTLVRVGAGFGLPRLLGLCRAGASTIFELAATGTPAILTPFPFAAHHQHVEGFPGCDLRGGAGFGARIDLGENLLEFHPTLAELLAVEEDGRHGHDLQAGHFILEQRTIHRLVADLRIDQRHPRGR